MDAKWGAGTRRSSARAELAKVLSSLPEATTFMVVPFSDGVGKFTSNPKNSLTQNVDEAMQVVKAFPRGGTNTQGALNVVYNQMLTGYSTENARIYLLSDGSPRGDANKIVKGV